MTEAGGVFHVLGSHTYATSGEFPIQVAISQALGHNVCGLVPSLYFPQLSYVTP